MDNKTFFPDFKDFFSTGLFDVIDDYHGVHAEIYDLLRGDTEKEVAFYQTLLPLNDAVIAELGCGTGSLTIPLSIFCTSILAIENSPDMLSKFREKCSRRPRLTEVIQLRQEDFTDFPDAHDGPFDLIAIPYNTLVHIMSPQKHLKLFLNCAASLKPSGYLVVDLWMPMRYTSLPFKRCSIVNNKKQAWVMYSQEQFLPPNTRVLNMMIVSLRDSRKPVLTAVREYIFRRSEIRGLFGKAGLKVHQLPSTHPLLQGNKQRLIYIGKKE